MSSSMSPALAAALRCKNGQSKLHGGLSSGPKTPEGGHRIRLALLKQGQYTKQARGRSDCFSFGLSETSFTFAILVSRPEPNRAHFMSRRPHYSPGLRLKPQHHDSVPGHSRRIASLELAKILAHPQVPYFRGAMQSHIGEMQGDGR